MTKLRLVILLAAAFGLLLLAGSASAQSQSPQGGEGGGEGIGDCTCFTNGDLGGEADDGLDCAINRNCGQAKQCHDDGDCTGADKGFCLAYGDSGCGDPELNNCGPGFNEACQGTCAHQTLHCQDDCPAGVAEFELCPDWNRIPTLSQWGLILFGMLLLTLMFLTIRRRGLPTHLSASLLVIGAVGLAMAATAYDQIQSERVCGASDIAVEFVNDILKS